METPNMVTIKRFEVRFYPTKSQEKKILLAKDMQHKIYRKSLHVFIQAYFDQENLTKYEPQVHKMLTSWRANDAAINSVCRRVLEAPVRWARREIQKSMGRLPHIGQHSLKYPAKATRWHETYIHLTNIGKLKTFEWEEANEWYVRKVRIKSIQKGSITQWWAIVKASDLPLTAEDRKMAKERKLRKG